jgi:hypothetical protein
VNLGHRGSLLRDSWIARRRYSMRESQNKNISRGRMRPGARTMRFPHVGHTKAHGSTGSWRASDQTIARRMS